NVCAQSGDGGLRFGGGQSLHQLPGGFGTCSFQVAIDDIRAPEQPVTGGTGGAFGQFYDIPVEGDGAGSGGGPTAILEHSHFTGTIRRFTVFTVRYGDIVFLVKRL